MSDRTHYYQRMNSEERIFDEAYRVASLYYYQDLNTEQIAKEMGFSRPKVSKLLSYARQHGIVDIKVYDTRTRLSPLETIICNRFALKRVHIVPVPSYAGESVWLERVARYTANYLNQVLVGHQVLGIAWGTTISEISMHLIPKVLIGMKIVQLNGSANTALSDNRYAANILQAFADNYQASVQLFPVPSFFDYEDTKRALWRERSIQAILRQQQEADVLLYSVGAVHAGVPSRVYAGDYLEPEDLAELKREEVVGDISTVFYRADGSWADIPLNQRASGPPLHLFQSVDRALCVVAGRAKVQGLHAALQAGYMNELVVDEPTARELVKAYLPEHVASNGEVALS